VSVHIPKPIFPQKSKHVIILTLSNQPKEISVLETGTKAVDFTLPDQNKKNITLSKSLGKWVVLYFYPKALTPGCTTQACAIRGIQKSLEKETIVVYGISADNPDLLKRFEEKKELNFTLLSDPEKKVIRAYKAWGKKKFMGKEFDGIFRCTYIINPEGKIVHTMPKVKTKTHHEDVLNWIKENK